MIIYVMCLSCGHKTKTIQKNGLVSFGTEDCERCGGQRKNCSMQADSSPAPKWWDEPFKDMTTRNLFYSLRHSWDIGIQANACDDMKAIGITYEKAVPQTLYDGWMFFNCTGANGDLPSYLSDLPDGPVRYIGHGLTAQDAATLIKNQRLPVEKPDDPSILVPPADLPAE